MRSRKIPTRQVEARADNGNTYKIVEYTTQISVDEMDGPTPWTNGTSEWLLLIPGQRMRPVDTEDDVTFAAPDGMTLTKIS